jgi:hypothetical protein
MGKHSRRKAGYLPKVAAGAAPLALLFAGPATALAQDDPTATLGTIPLPLDHQREGTFDRGVDVSTEGDTSVVREFVDSTERNVFRKEVGDADVVVDIRRSVSERVKTRDGVTLRPDRVQALTANSDAEAITQGQRNAVNLNRYGSVVAGNETQLRQTSERLAKGVLDPRNATPGLVLEDRRGFGASEGTFNGVRALRGVGVIQETHQQAGSSLDRAVRFDGGFSGDLNGALDAARSSGHAVDLGELASVGTTSKQHGGGRFSGLLPLGGFPGTGADPDLGQGHAVGGNAGEVNGLVTTDQDVDLGNRTADLSKATSNRISGDLSVDHVAWAHADERTSMRGALPSTDPADLTQSGTLNVSVLNQPPTHTGVAVEALPLEIRRS